MAVPFSLLRLILTKALLFPYFFFFLEGLRAKLHYSSSPWYCHETCLVCLPENCRFSGKLFFFFSFSFNSSLCHIHHEKRRGAQAWPQKQNATEKHPQASELGTLQCHCSASQKPAETSNTPFPTSFAISAPCNVPQPTSHSLFSKRFDAWEKAHFSLYHWHGCLEGCF